MQQDMNGNYYQSTCAACRQCLLCKTRRNCNCTPLLQLEWSKDHTKDGALDFRKKKMIPRLNPGDLPAFRTFLTRENSSVNWEAKQEIVVNLCMNCDRKWRKFRDALNGNDNGSLSANDLTQHDSMDGNPGDAFHTVGGHSLDDLDDGTRVGSPGLLGTGLRGKRKRDANSLVQTLNYQPLLSTLLEQEQRLQFPSFTAEHALRLGLALVDAARTKPHPVTIDISMNSHQLFGFAMQGAGPDTAEWIRRKNNVTKRFLHSSFYMGVFLASLGMTLEDKYYISSAEFAPQGGSFPLIVKNVGVVGTISVSGLAHQEDHEIVVSTIEKYLEGYIGGPPLGPGMGATAMGHYMM